LNEFSVLLLRSEFNWLIFLVYLLTYALFTILLGVRMTGCIWQHIRFQTKSLKSLGIEFTPLEVGLKEIVKNLKIKKNRF